MSKDVNDASVYESFNPATDYLLASVLINGIESLRRVPSTVGDGSGDTAASIKTKYESNANTNAFTDALAAKLAAIEASATADQTATEIRDLLQTLSGTNRLSATYIKDLSVGAEWESAASSQTVVNGDRYNIISGSTSFTFDDTFPVGGAVELEDVGNVVAGGATITLVLDDEVTTLQTPDSLTPKADTTPSGGVATFVINQTTLGGGNTVHTRLKVTKKSATAFVLTVDRGESLPTTFKTTVTQDLSSISATSEDTVDFTVSGARAGDGVSLSVQSLATGLDIVNYEVTADDTVSVTFYNRTGSPIDPAETDYIFVIYK